MPTRPSVVPRPKRALHRLIARAPVGAIYCLVACFACLNRARAHEIADELTIGELSAVDLRTVYVTEQLEAEFTLNDTWFIMASAALTHLTPTATLRSADIPHYGVALGVTPLPKLELELVAQVAPPSSVFDVALAPTTYLFELQSQAYAGLVSATYDAGQQGDISTKFEASFGIGRYATQRMLFYEAATLSPADSTLSAILQYHGLATATVGLFNTIDLALSAAYYGYFGNFTTPDGQNIILANGLPLEPLRFAIRGSAVYRLGDSSIGAHLQRAQYASGLGGSWSGGAKLDLSVSESVDLSLSGELQRALFTDGTMWNVFGVTVGASFAF